MLVRFVVVSNHDQRESSSERFFFILLSFQLVQMCVRSARKQIKFQIQIAVGNEKSQKKRGFFANVKLSNLARQRSTFGIERRKVCGVRQARPARQVRLGPAQRGKDSCGSNGDQVRRRLGDDREGQDEAAQHRDARDGSANEKLEHLCRSRAGVYAIMRVPVLPQALNTAPVNMLGQYA